MLYVTGFLVVFAFQESFGLHPAGGDYFRIKYIHVGFLCSISIAIVAALSHSWFWYRGRKSAEKTNWQSRSKQAIVIVLLLVTGLYMQLVLAPPSSMPLLAMIALTVVVVAWLVNASWPKLFGKKKVLSAFIMAVSVMFALSELATLTGPHWLAATLPWPHVRLSLGAALTVLLAFFLGRLTYLWHQEHVDPTPTENRVLFFVLTVPLGLFVFYNVITGFARCIYPHIPTSKGGGDYRDAVPAILHARHQDADVLPDDLRLKNPANRYQSDDVIVLLETDDYLYVVQDRPGERGLWGKGGDKSRPTIYQISRTGVAQIEFSSPATSPKRAP
jgi:hypothetical protein